MEAIEAWKKAQNGEEASELDVNSVSDVEKIQKTDKVLAQEEKEDDFYDRCFEIEAKHERLSERKKFEKAFMGCN